MAKEFDGEEISSNEKEKTISFNYLVQGVNIGVNEVERIKNIELKNLQSLRKLCLVLDLDHTLVHSRRLVGREGRISWKGDDDIYQWKLRPGEDYLTKLRPFVGQFLEEASEMFELYVYTLASRDYALRVVGEFLDPQGIYFGQRVISLNDSTLPGHKGLDVVPVHPSAVLILDDKDSVWKPNFDNLIVIAQYRFFSQLGGDERKGEEELRFALQVLKKIHTVYFKWYDCFKDGDVRELMQTHWEDIVNDQGLQEVGTGTCSSHLGLGKRSMVDDACSSTTKKQRN